MAIRLQGWRLAGLGLEKEFLLCWTFPQLQARPRLSLVRSPGGDMHAGPDGQWSAVSQSYWKLTRFFPTGTSRLECIVITSYHLHAGPIQRVPRITLQVK